MSSVDPTTVSAEEALSFHVLPTEAIGELPPASTEETEGAIQSLMNASGCPHTHFTGISELRRSIDATPSQEVVDRVCDLSTSLRSAIAHNAVLLLGEWATRMDRDVAFEERALRLFDALLHACGSEKGFLRAASLVGLLNVAKRFSGEAVMQRVAEAAKSRRQPVLEAAGRAVLRCSACSAAPGWAATTASSAVAATSRLMASPSVSAKRAARKALANFGKNEALRRSMLAAIDKAATRLISPLLRQDMRRCLDGAAGRASGKGARSSGLRSFLAQARSSAKSARDSTRRGDTSTSDPNEQVAIILPGPAAGNAAAAAEKQAAVASPATGAAARRRLAVASPNASSPTGKRSRAAATLPEKAPLASAAAARPAGKRSRFDPVPLGMTPVARRTRAALAAVEHKPEGL